MAIVIKEIILSDTLEKFMEKVNFNFDQLMLAGGGPQGPVGPAGPIGPIGPKGDQGNKWYVGCTGTTAAIGSTLYEGDLFLQKGDCGGATYPLGQVLSFNEISDIFVDTGLNLRGPTGASGATGTNTGWAVYPGVTIGAVWNGTSIESTPGPTPSFTLLKGDAFGATGLAEHPEYSRDILYLGGFRGMLNQSTVYSLGRLPKLFVSPKTIMDASRFFGATGGKAGSGIALVREPQKTGAIYTPINPSSYSNIFIDDEMNLNLTNFSDYDSALTLDSTITNDINLMSKRGIKLIGGHYDYAQADSVGEFSSSLQTINFTDNNGIFDETAGGFNLIQRNNNGLGQIELLGQRSQLRISAARTSIQTDYPDVAFWLNNPTTNTSDVFRIGVGAYDLFKNASKQKDLMPFIGAGWMDSTTNYPYIGFGTKPGGGTKPSIVVTDKYLVAGAMGTYDPADLGSLQPYSADFGGQIRMRYTAGTTGNVLLSVDNMGTAEWAPADQVGGWKNDPSCARKIEISKKDTRFASFQPGTGINYTRVDIPSLGSNISDLYFGNYNETDKTVNQGHIISKSYSGGYGELSISTGILKECPSGITTRELQTGSIERKRLVVGAYGEIVIGSTATNDPDGSGLTKGLSLDSLKIYGFTSETGWDRMNPNIHLIPGGGNVNGKIKFTPRVYATGNEDGYDNTTSFEVLRTYDTSANSGPGNIRFLGVGKSTKTPTTADDKGLPSSLSTGRGSTGDVGSHVMMIADAQFKNKYGEVGKTYDYYELVDKNMYVRNISATFASKDGVSPSYPHLYAQYTLNKWGTVASGWNNMTTPGAYNQFQGSRSTLFGEDGGPLGIKLDNSGIDLFTPGLAPIPNYGIPGANNGPDYLNAWLSPTTGFRFSPINLSQPGGQNKGLTWVDFNIDMGLIFETVNNVDSLWSNGYPGYVFGLGSHLGASHSVNDKKDAMARSMKVKHIKIILDSNQLGISSLLDNRDLTNRRNPLNPLDSEGVQPYDNNSPISGAGTFYTDWQVGVVKPMHNLAGLGNSYAGSSTVEYDGMWFDGSGRQKWINVSNSAGECLPFQSDPSNLVASEYNTMIWSTLASDVIWRAHNWSTHRNMNQYGSFMWRIYTSYDQTGLPAAPNNSILEIYFYPDVSNSYPVYGNYWKSTGGSLPAQSDDEYWGLQQSRGGFYPNVPIMQSKYVQYQPEGDVDRLILEPLLTNAPRTLSFYKSHGFSMSGQATVKWNRANGVWSSTAEEDPSETEASL